MFNFFKHKAEVPEVGAERTEAGVESQGSITTNSDAIESCLNIEGELKAPEDINLNYSSPEFVFAENQLKLDPEAFIKDFEDELPDLSNTDLSPGEPVFDFTDGLFVDEGEASPSEGGQEIEAVLSEVPDTEGEVLENDEGEKISFFQRYTKAGVALAAALPLALVACNQKTKNDVTFSPGVGVEKREDGTYGIKIRLSVDTENETTSKENPENHSSATNQNSEVNKATPSKERNGTYASQEGPGEKIKQYLGAFTGVENGLPTKKSTLILNPATNMAIKHGIIGWDAKNNVYALQIMESHANQGIPVDSFVYYRLMVTREGVFPAYGKLGGVKSFREYTKEGKGNMSTFDYDQFDKDVKKSIDPNDPNLMEGGKPSQRKFDSALYNISDHNHAILRVIVEFSKLDEAGRKRAYETRVKPLMDRK